MTSTHRRLDPDIFAAARKALDDEPRVPQDVRVHVDRGTVTLTGTVRWPHEEVRSRSGRPSDRWRATSRQQHHRGECRESGRLRSTRIPLLTRLRGRARNCIRQEIDDQVRMDVSSVSTPSTRARGVTYIASSCSTIESSRPPTAYGFDTCARPARGSSLRALARWKSCANASVMKATVWARRTEPSS